MIDPTQPLRLGNLYALMAFVAMEHVTPSQSEPLGLIVLPDGTLNAVSAEHAPPGSPGFVGWLSADTDQARLAQRIAAAHAKLLAA